MTWKEEIKKQSKLADFDIDRLQRVVAVVDNLVENSEVNEINASTEKSLRNVSRLVKLVMKQTKTGGFSFVSGKYPPAEREKGEK